MGFGSFLRGIGRVARKVVSGVQKGTQFVSDAFRKVDDVMNSPVGNLVMMALQANPKTRNAAMKLQQGVSQGRQYSEIAAGLSKGEQDAIQRAVEVAGQGGRL